MEFAYRFVDTNEVSLMTTIVLKKLPSFLPYGYIEAEKNGNLFCMNDIVNRVLLLYYFNGFVHKSYDIYSLCKMRSLYLVFASVYGNVHNRIASYAIDNCPTFRVGFDMNSSCCRIVGYR